MATPLPLLVVRLLQYSTRINTQLTSIDERILGIEATVVLVLVRVKTDDEDVMHRDEQSRKLIDIGATVTAV